MFSHSNMCVLVRNAHLFLLLPAPLQYGAGKRSISNHQHQFSKTLKLEEACKQRAKYVFLMRGCSTVVRDEK